jgi:hypothetical protein
MCCKIGEKGREKMFDLNELRLKVQSYKTKLTEMGNSL